jgi:hypothetical protein
LKKRQNTAKKVSKPYQKRAKNASKQGQKITFLRATHDWLRKIAARFLNMAPDCVNLRLLRLPRLARRVVKRRLRRGEWQWQGGSGTSRQRRSVRFEWWQCGRVAVVIGGVVNENK